MTRKFKAPDKYLLDVFIPAMDTHASKILISGDSVKMIQMGNAVPVDAATRQKMKANQQIVPELSYLTDGSTFTLSPDIFTDDAGNDSYVVTVAAPDGQTIVLYYDVKTSYRVKTEAHVGDQVASVVESSDYRDVSGIKFPYSLKNFISGQELNFKVTDLKVNSGLSDEDFK
jgi:hypothetical protein